MEEAGFTVSTRNLPAGHVFMATQADGKRSFDVSFTQVGVVAGIVMPGEIIVDGSLQPADGGGDNTWRTFRFGYGERFHVFGGGPRREIAICRQVDDEPGPEAAETMVRGHMIERRI